MSIRSIAILLCLFAASLGAPIALAAPAKPAPKKEPAPKTAGVQQVTYHLMGLFDADCENLLRTALAEMPGVALVRIDLQYGEATFSFDADAAFPRTKPEKTAERFDQLLRPAAGHMLSLQPQSTTPKEKLKTIELPVIFLDCRACGLALHEMLMKQDGVQQALVDFKTHKVTALIDPEKTNEQTLEAFLKKREVTLKH